mmetsp:Transcript_14108/g.30654  ORF Transcript_14108/g.30654 Transcript_14108/m.30654 type:complete len:425 (-) Transcript_14108:1019-2293(-)
MLGGGHLLPRSRDDAIGDDENDLVLFRVRRVRHRVDRLYELLPSLVVARDHDDDLVLRVLVRIRARSLGDVHQGTKHLGDHDERHKAEEEVHDDVEDEADDVETCVDDAHVEELVHAPENIVVGVHAQEELGCVLVQLVDDQIVQRRLQVSFRVVLLDLLRLLVSDVVDVLGNIVDPIVDGHPERERALEQHGAVVGQVSLEELPHILGRGIHPSNKLVAGETILLVLIGHVLADGILHLELLVVHELGLVETHVGEEYGGRAREHTGGVVVQERLYAGGPGGMALEESPHVVHHAVEHDPVLVGTLLDVAQCVDRLLPTEHDGNEPEDANEEAARQEHHEADSDLFPPRLLGLRVILLDAPVGDGECNAPAEVVPPHGTFVIVRLLDGDGLGLLGDLARGPLAAPVPRPAGDVGGLVVLSPGV